MIFRALLTTLLVATGTAKTFTPTSRHSPLDINRGGSISPKFAVGLAGVSTLAYGLEMAFPETAAEKYVEGNVHSKESKFWTGWFSVSLVQTAIMIFTIHKYVDEADLANACKFVAAAVSIAFAKLFFGNTSTAMDALQRKVTAMILGIIITANLSASGLCDALLPKAATST